MSNQRDKLHIMPNIMFKHASAFLDCTYFCHTEVDLKNTSFRLTQHLGIPDIVILCFACEVFMKSLLILNGKTEDEVRGIGHHLQKLWEEYEKIDSVSAQNFLSFFSRNYSKQAFDNIIKIIDNNFQDVRYLYETINVHTDRTFLLYLCMDLREFCCEKIHGCKWDEFVANGCNW